MSGLQLQYGLWSHDKTCLFEALGYMPCIHCRSLSVSGLHILNHLRYFVSHGGWYCTNGGGDGCGLLVGGSNFYRLLSCLLHAAGGYAPLY